jgi:tRNA-splicing ligase RtcB
MKIFGTHDDATLTQLKNCVDAAPDAVGVLCADGHLGYSMPIGGVVAYRDHVSPSGVGYDIACGNMAVKLDVRYEDIHRHANRIADEIFSRVSFGVGRKNDEPVDDPVLDLIRNSPVPQQRGLLTLAEQQLGTVGSGNHYVDVLEDQNGYTWIAVHFGSRGFGHKTATMFMNVAQGLPIDARGHDGEMMAPPLLLGVKTPAGQDYLNAMDIAGEYAYAGRRQVVQRVREVLGNPAVLDTVHNHHNFAWAEQHNPDNQEWHSAKYFVHRKGATPAFPDQRGFIGGSMNDMCVIVRGRNDNVAREALYSTVHGAGRVMSRNAAIKGKHTWSCANAVCVLHDYALMTRTPPKDLKCSQCHAPLVKKFLTPPVDFAAVQTTVRDAGVVLRGAGADEAPQCYRSLRDVLAAHEQTITLETIMRPRIVCMAGKDVRDPYKD